MEGNVFPTERLKAQGGDCELSLYSISPSKWVICVNVLIKTLYVLTNQ